MGMIFFIAGVALAAYAGYTGLEWYFILISSFLMTIGWCFIRASFVLSIISEDGFFVAIPKLLLIQIVIYSIITTPTYFIALFFSSDQSSDQTESFESVTAHTDQMYKICEAASEEAQNAITWRESGKSLDEAIKKITVHYLDNEYMKEYAIKIWTTIYSDPENFKPNNAKRLVLDGCVYSLQEKSANARGVDLVTFACQDKATLVKQLTNARDAGMSKEKMRSKFIETSKKGDPALELIGAQEKTLEGVLSGVDYVYSNKNQNPDQIYKSYLADCISKNKN